MKKNLSHRTLFGLLFVFLFLQAATLVAQNPVPVLASISPDHKVQHLPTFVLTASGSDFIPGSTIVFNGVPKLTAYISATELQCMIYPNDILVPPGNINLIVPVHVWTPPPGGGNSQIVNFTVHSEHAFNASIEVSGTNNDSRSPQVAVNSPNIVHVAWIEEENGISSVYYRRSTDLGATWEGIHSLGHSTDSSTLISLNAYQATGFVYVFYHVYDGVVYNIYYRLSSDNGTTWGAAVLIMGYPDIPPPYLRTDANGNFLTLGYKLNFGAYDVGFGRSVNQGVTWPIRTNVSNNAGDSRYPAFDVAANGGILAAWKDDTMGVDEIYYARSGNNGATFTPPAIIANSLNNLDIEVEAGSPGEVYIFWVWGNPQFPWNCSLYMSYSNNNGANFNAGISPISFSSAWWEKSVCVDTAGNINHVASDWDWSNSYYYAGFTSSVDRGVNWAAIDTVSPVTIDVYDLDMTVDAAGNIYMVWEGIDNQTFTDWQIYFCRSEH